MKTIAILVPKDLLDQKDVGNVQGLHQFRGGLAEYHKCDQIVYVGNVDGDFQPVTILKNRFGKEILADLGYPWNKKLLRQEEQGVV